MNGESEGKGSAVSGLRLRQADRAAQFLDDEPDKQEPGSQTAVRSGRRILENTRPQPIRNSRPGIFELNLDPLFAQRTASHEDRPRSIRVMDRIADEMPHHPLQLRPMSPHLQARALQVKIRLQIVLVLK